MLTAKHHTHGNNTPINVFQKTSADRRRRRKKISIRNCGSTVKRQSPDWESDDDFAVPFIETLPAANLLFSGGTVGSCTLFIFAICKTFAITA